MTEKETNRWCCRIYPIVLIFISTAIAAAIWYFDEEVQQFIFKSWGEFIQFLGTALFIAIIPIGLFYYLNDKEKFQQKSKLFALLGFIPALLYMVFIIL